MLEGPPKPNGEASVVGKRPLTRLRIAIMLAAMGLIAWYVVGHWRDFRVLENIGVLALLCAMAINALAYFWSGWMIRALVRPFGLTIGFHEASLLSLVTRFGNVFMPFRGGAAVRAIYLNRLHGLPYTHFVSGLAGQLVVALFVSAVCSMAGLIWAWAATGTILWSIFIPVACLPVIVGVLAVWHPRLRERGPWLWRVAAKILNGWHDLCRTPRTVLVVLAMSLVHVLTLAVVYGVLLRQIDAGIPWSLLVVIVALGNLTTILMITPGNVGVYEGGMALIGQVVGVSPASILAVTLIWRALDTAFILAAGPLCSLALTRWAAPAEIASQPIAPQPIASQPIAPTADPPPPAEESPLLAPSRVSNSA